MVVVTSTVPSGWPFAGALSGSVTRRWIVSVWSGVVLGEWLAGAAPAWADFPLAFFFFFLRGGGGVAAGAGCGLVAACGAGGVRSVRARSTRPGCAEGCHSI